MPTGYNRLPTFNSHPSAIRPRKVLALLKIAVPVAFLIVLIGLSLWEPRIELVFYPRKWLQTEIFDVPPLSGCFDSISERYNASDALYGRRRTEVQVGMEMKHGLDCYNFAGTVQPEPRNEVGPLPDGERVKFHTYWRVDLLEFTERHEWMIKSFFATQDTDRSKLILWSNGDLSGNPILRKWLRSHPRAFELQIVDIPELSKGTALDGSKLLKLNDTRAWLDGDLIRLLLLYQHGGVWIDMDSLLTRDLTPLLEHEFVTQWDCYDKIYQPLNGALMHFHQHSPYLCEAFYIMQTSTIPRPGSTDWGALVYFKLWRRVVAAQFPPFKILPWCFSDGRSCRLDNRLPDPFIPDPSDRKWTLGLGVEEQGGLDQALTKVFAVHLHNQWWKMFPEDGWVERLLLRRYSSKLGIP